MVFQQFVYDDGTKTWLNSDVADTQDWTSLERLFDDNGALYQQNAVLDDSAGRILTLYDVGNVETWDQWIRQFDDNGVLLSEEFVNWDWIWISNDEVEVHNQNQI